MVEQKRFRSRAYRDDGRQSMAQFRGGGDVDPVAIRRETEASRLDRLDIQDSLDSAFDGADEMNSNITTLASRLDVLESELPTRVIGFARISILNGDVTFDSTYNLSLNGLDATSLTLDFDENQSTDYAAEASNQLDDDTDLYYTRNRAAGEFEVRSYSLGFGAPIANDMTVGTYEFVVTCRRAV